MPVKTAEETKAQQGPQQAPKTHDATRPPVPQEAPRAGEKRDWDDDALRAAVQHEVSLNQMATAEQIAAQVGGDAGEVERVAWDMAEAGIIPRTARVVDPDREPTGFNPEPPKGDVMPDGSPIEAPPQEKSP